MEEEKSRTCTFASVLEICNDSKTFASKELSDQQKNTIIKSSKERRDEFFVTITTGSGPWEYHKDCYSAYTSKEKIDRYLRKRKEGRECDERGQRKKLRSSGSQFDFKSLCIFCGKKCEVEKDPKHPSRWEEAYLSRTADRGIDEQGKKRKSFKEVLLSICNKRNDIQSDNVSIRLEGVYDLHAADARYHKKCYCDFVSDRNIKAALNQYDQESEDKESFNFILNSIKNDPERIWHATELLNEYNKKGGFESNTTRFLERIKEYLKDEIYCFKSPGLSKIVMHKSKATIMFKVIQSNEEEEEIALEKIAMKIKKEAKEVSSLKDTYPVLNSEELSKNCLPSLTSLLSYISPKRSTDSKIMAMISSIVTSSVTSKPSMLQVALGLLVEQKKLIEHLYEYGITASYDEVRRFKISAAYFAGRENIDTLCSENGLIQGISDNLRCKSVYTKWSKTNSLFGNHCHTIPE